MSVSYEPVEIKIKLEDMPNTDALKILLVGITYGIAPLYALLGTPTIAAETSPIKNSEESAQIERQFKPPALHKSLATSLPNLTIHHQETAKPDSLAELESVTNAPTSNMAQVTSVSQLSDVQPTDWAFSALQSLVERYGCIAGYPDSNFRGNRALTRYEFAAGLNACLDQINRQIAGTTANLTTKEDLAVLQKLQAEFGAELAILRGRINTLEARTTELESNQFSTTTKLSGLVYFSLTGTNAGGTIKAEGTTPLVASRDDQGNPIQRRVREDSEVTFSHLVWLILNTSFTGKDSLMMVLATGNGEPGITPYTSAGQYLTAGVPFTVHSPLLFESNKLILRDFYYTFPISDKVKVTVGPRVNWYAHFDKNVFNPGDLSGASSFSSAGNDLFTNPNRGSGAVVEWYPNNYLELRAGYMAENEEYLSGIRTAANPTKGLFGRSNSFTAELTVKPNSRTNIRLTYSHQNLPENGSGQLDVRRPIAGVLDDGPGGRSNGGLGGASTDVVGVNFDWLVTRRFGLFGRYGYASAHLQVKDGSDADVNVQTFQAGLAFPDLGKQGALATLSFVVPMDIIKGRRFFVSGAGDGGTQYEIEGSYFLPMTDNISLVPSFYAIVNLNNFQDNPTVFVGHLRTQFSF
ncbi:MAG TPA: iron uptake porin [Kamptonema sp.]|nr:iron uptake porin [Kamptonema sp.]